MVNDTTDQETPSTQFDEYLWPLTEAAWPLDWRRFAEEHRLRQRLNEILAHVHAMHVLPRVRRLSAGNRTAEAAITQSIISGLPGGEPWQLSLHEPVPRALRDEWAALSAELRAMSRRPTTTAAAR